jgi:hypothetical protein
MNENRWFMPWRWKPWTRWTLVLAVIFVAYLLSFDLVRFVLTSIGKNDWWWMLFQTVYVPAHHIRRLIGFWP